MLPFAILLARLNPSVDLLNALLHINMQCIVAPEEFVYLFPETELTSVFSFPGLGWGWSLFCLF